MAQVRDRWRAENGRVNLVRPMPAPQPVNVEATPQPLTLDLARTALVVVDMQNDFLDPRGWFADVRGADPTALWSVIDPINALTSACRAVGVPVIHLNWAIRPDVANLPANVLDKGSNCGAQPGYGEEIAAGPVLAAGAWGARSLPAIICEPGDITVGKHRLSGFRDNELDAILRRLGISTLVYTGVNLDRCVFATLADGCFQGFDALLIEDATATVSAPPMTEAILTLIRQMYGFTTTSAALLQALASYLPPTPNLQGDMP